jgi:pSer/pThr/pTyr-binding forkhead associated (FHA) protein
MIGRGEANEINLADDSVSSMHARIYFDERVGSICIEDLHSLNGIFVNDMPTSKNILRDGDKIRIGNLEMTFKDTGFIYQGS